VQLSGEKLSDRRQFAYVLAFSGRVMEQGGRAGRAAFQPAVLAAIGTAVLDASLRTAVESSIRAHDRAHDRAERWATVVASNKTE
jgi:hypothetical protein